jgi:DNA-binding NarL/FixJ family response regulator
MSDPNQTLNVMLVKREALLAIILLRVCREVFGPMPIRLHTSGLSALEALREEPADFLICGLNLPDLDGLDLLHLAKEEGLARRFLAVTDRRDERVIQFLIAGGHNVSFVSIEVADTEPLENALRSVADGRNVCDLQLRAEWVRLRGDPQAYGWILTDAEQDVLAALAVLGGDHEVASYRGTSPATVQTQRKRIMQKLNLRTQAQLVSYAACRGLVRYEAGEVLRPGFQWKELRRKCDGGGGLCEAALI